MNKTEAKDIPPPAPGSLPPSGATAGRVAKAAALLASLALLGKGIGFLRQIVIAENYGAGPGLDAFLVAITIPEMAATIAMYVSLNLFLPLYVAERERSEGEAGRLASAFLGRVTATLLLGSAVLAAAAPWVVRTLAPDLEGPYYRTAVGSLRILAFMVLLRGMEGCLRGILNAHRKFFLPTLGAVSVNIVVIAAVVGLAAELGIMALSWGTAIGCLVPVAVVLPLALRTVPGLLKGLRATHPLLGEVGRLLPWIVAIEACGLVLPLIDRALASRFLPPGRISALTYARLLADVPFDLAGITLATTLFPEFASLFARGDRSAFRGLVRRGVRATVAILLPVGALLIALRIPVARAVYERGAFDPQATALTAQALWAYATGLPFLGATLIVAQAAYAARMFRRLVVVRVVALALKVAVALALIPSLGHAGIALGTTAFHAFVLAALIPPLLGGWRGLVPSPAVLLLGVTLAVGTGWGLSALLVGPGGEAGIPGLGAQVLVWGTAGLVYVGVCRVGRVEEVLWAERLVVRRLFGREARA